MWREFRTSRIAGGRPDRPISSWHFCDNKQDADECARLVVSGRKRATAPSLWSFERDGEALPQPGDLHVITDWEGIAQCIIRITGVEIIPLDRITEEHARREGEGDGSLAWWHRAHWAYYHRELLNSAYEPQPDMPIVFQRFECVYR
ncbi:ASCH domain-containing protein [Massilia consociata]|uniref:ASCH domain-containing protein n=1 Tax=Massilia consociata TaxID=760117 RepID=A0ABV6FIY6_9BURK